MTFPQEQRLELQSLLMLLRNTFFPEKFKNKINQISLSLHIIRHVQTDFCCFFDSSHFLITFSRILENIHNFGFVVFFSRISSGPKSKNFDSLKLVVEKYNPCLRNRYFIKQGSGELKRQSTWNKISILNRNVFLNTNKTLFNFLSRISNTRAKFLFVTLPVIMMSMLKVNYKKLALKKMPNYW